MDQEAIMYLTFCSLTLIIAVANVSQIASGIMGYVVIFLVVIAFAFFLIMTFADYVVFPLATGMLGITFQPARNYKITKGQEAVIKNVGGIYYAIGYATANIFSYVFKAERIQENEEERRVQSPESWERAVMSIPFPFKFHVLSVGRDVQTVRDELEGKRSYQEFQLSQAMKNAESNEMVITDIQRKIDVIQTQMDRISQEEKPVATLMYLETVAIGISEKAAMDALAAQIKQLQIAMSALDVQVMRVVGRELYTLFKFGFAMPTTYDEIATNFDTEG
jgi:prepilin signal peptidase PulO-like enzyme (type II secretory pathway)